MLGFCLSYKKPNVWITTALKAATAGLKIIPDISPPPPPGVVEGLQLWLNENTLKTPPKNPKVIERQFADNAVFGIDPQLADSLPSLAQLCLKEKGLQYKKSWDIWCQTAYDFKNPCFQIRAPEEGLVVVGGLVHDTEALPDADVLIGRETFLEKHVDAFVEKIEVICRKFSEVVALAAQAHHAERISFKVFVNTMKQRATYFLRVFPPEVSRKAAKRLTEIFQNVTMRILGWTPEEWDAAKGQAALHPEDGGHGENALDDEAPLLHLASWLGATHSGSITVEHFFDGSIFAQRMQSLYLQVQQINASLPDSLELFIKQVLATNSFLKKVKGGGKRVLWGKALGSGMRETKLQAWKRKACKEQQQRVSEMKGDWILLEPPVSRGFSRKTWLVAMRFRYGLNVEPVFLPRMPSSVCVSQRSWGEKRGENLGCCAAQLDSKGRHAVTCHVGGKTIRRHDSIVHRLADLLKKFVVSCATEVYVFELEQICPETGEWTEAKLDLDVVTRDGRFLLDVSVFHPFQSNGKAGMRHANIREREKKKYERYPMTRDGQRVTEAVLIPVILNTYGAIGEKAVEFLYAVAGKEAKRIIDEISMLAVLLSADMILMSHAPSNLPNLLPAKPAAPQPVEKPAAEREDGKDENGFLRSDLRGEIKDKKVECLGCSTGDKKFFHTAASWYWNRHVQRVHMQPQTGEADVSPVAQLDTQPDVQPSASPLAEQRAQRKTGSDETGAGKRTAQQPAVPEVQPPAAQDVSNILRVVEAKKPKKACGSGQKQQSSLGSRKERTVPSTKSDSHKSKAGKRSNLVPVISNSATVQKSVKDTSTFSSKNVTRHFSHPD